MFFRTWTAQSALVADMTNHRPGSTLPAPLSPKLAFIVHLTGTEPSPTEVLTGRVEHVTSGRSLRFTSCSQLVEFMQRAVASQDQAT